MASINNKKYSIIELLTNLEDEQFVDLILELMLKHEHSNQPLSPEELHGIQEALNQIENGEYYTEEETKKRFDKWLK